MLTPHNGVGFYSYMLHGVWRYLKNIDEVNSPRFFIVSTLTYGLTRNQFTQLKTNYNEEVINDFVRCYDWCWRIRTEELQGSGC